MLRLAGVSVADIGRDYAESEERLAESHARWVAQAADEQERAVMEQVLTALEKEHGSVRGYLLGAGAEAAALHRLRVRVRA